MRAFVIAALSLSTSVMACPSLNGNYKLCTSSTGATSSDAVLTQSTRNGVTTYSMTSTEDSSGERSTETYIADGKVRTTTESDPESGMTFVTKTVTTCVGSSLKVNLKISVDGENFADMNLETTKTGQRLSSKTTGVIFGENVTESEICE